MAKKRKFSLGLTVFCSILALIIGFAGGAAVPFVLNKPSGGDLIPAADELSVHVMQLGNHESGDSVYIKAGDVDILVDGGSNYSSLSTIRTYVDAHVEDGILEYVIVTHADLDHIACFAGASDSADNLFDYYQCKTIIDFARTKKTTAAYGRYVKNRDEEVAIDGAVHYTALQCYNNEGGAQRVYKLSDSIELEILYQKYYEENHDDENNYSVCFLLRHGERNFLFTGDLEYDGEMSLKDSNNLPKVDFFKAGHHGSKTSSNDDLLKVIQPKIVAVSCAASSVKYLTNGTQNLHNTFPTQAFLDRVAKYTTQVYVTTLAEYAMDAESGRYKDTGEWSMLNGHIVVTSEKDEVSVSCSNNNTPIKDTDWIRMEREMPISWQTVTA